jgi:hypothetical protein
MVFDAAFYDVGFDDVDGFDFWDLFFSLCDNWDCWKNLKPDVE